MMGTLWCLFSPLCFELQEAVTMVARLYFTVAALTSAAVVAAVVFSDFVVWVAERWSNEPADE